MCLRQVGFVALACNARNLQLFATIAVFRCTSRIAIKTMYGSLALTPRPGLYNNRAHRIHIKIILNYMKNINVKIKRV